MSDGLGGSGYRPEECWACQGYGVVHGPLGLDGTRQRWYCPWCRGTAVLYDGAHEHGGSCDCCPRDWSPGDDWFALTGHGFGDVVVARLPRDPDLRARIEASLAREADDRERLR